MAQPSKPSKKIPVTDPNHIPEVFANEVVGAYFAEGVVAITFACHRVQAGDASQEAPAVERQVVCRLVLTQNGLAQLHNNLTRLANAVALAKNPTPPVSNQPN